MRLQLAKMRKRSGMTQKDLAGRLGVTSSVLSAWEHQKTHPSLNNISDIADILGTSVDILCGRSESEGESNSELDDVLQTFKGLNSGGQHIFIETLRSFSLDPKRKSGGIDDFGSKLKKIRKDRGLTQSQMANMLEVDLQNYGLWERSYRTPSVKIAMQIADILHCSLDSLCGRAPSTTTSTKTFNNMENLFSNYYCHLNTAAKYMISEVLRSFAYDPARTSDKKDE